MSLKRLSIDSSADRWAYDSLMSGSSTAIEPIRLPMRRLRPSSSLPASCMVFLLLLSGCGFYDAFRRLRQISTTGDLQQICFRIDRARERNRGYISATAANALIRAVHGGRDAWGNQIAFMSNEDPAHFVYVVVSPGSDGRLNRSREEYFRMAQKDVKGLWDEDILFRNGEAITLAGS